MVEATAASVSLSIRLISDESAVGTGIIPSLAYSYALSGDPFAYLDDVAALERIGEWAAAGEYQALIREMLLDSALTSTVVTYPVPGAREEKDAALARSLQEVTSHALDQFDSYMTRIDKVSGRDEKFEQNAAELLREMRQESKDMSTLINGLTEKMQGLSAPSDAPADKTLEDIRTLMASLDGRVKTVSETLARLSEEA